MQGLERLRARLHPQHSNTQPHPRANPAYNFHLGPSPPMFDAEQRGLIRTAHRCERVRHRRQTATYFLMVVTPVIVLVVVVVPVPVNLLHVYISWRERRQEAARSGHPNDNEPTY